MQHRHRANRRSGARQAFQRAARPGSFHGGSPGRNRLEAGLIPPGWFQPRVIILAGENVVERNRARPGLPAPISRDAVGRAIRIIQPDLSNHPERAERLGELDVADRVPRDAIHAIAEDDANGVPAAMQLRRQIQRVVKAGFFVLRPAGGEQAVAHLAAIDGQLILAQAAHMNDGPAQSGFHREFMTE